MESVTRACRTLLDAFRAEGVEDAELDPVGLMSGFDHHPVVVGARQGWPDEINDFVNRLRAHL